MESLHFQEYTRVALPPQQYPFYVPDRCQQRIHVRRFSPSGGFYHRFGLQYTQSDTLRLYILSDTPPERDQLWSADDVRKQLEQSLKNLQTDYIDLYQFHSGNDEAFANDELWTMLSKQVDVGKIRQIGISLSSNAGVRDYQAVRVAGVGADAVQVVYSRLDRGAEEVVFPHCLQDGLGVLARVPLASGFLTGKYAPGVTFPEGDYRASLGQEKLDAMAEEAARIKETEVPPGTPMAAWALAWCLKNEAVACVIPGARNVDQLKANAAAAEMAEDTHPLAMNG